MSMQQLASNQVSAEIPVNRNFQTLEHQSVYGQRQSAHAGLTWGYYGGRWGGFSVADGTLALTNTTTNYVVVALATGVISTSTATTNWNDTANYARVYRITTAAGAVTNNSGSDFDYRAGPGGISSAGATGTGAVTSVDASGGVQTASGSAITSTGTIRGAHVINAQTGTSYALVTADRGAHVTLSNAAAVAVSIAQAGTTGFENGWFSFVENIGAGAATITPATSTVNGAATLVLTTGMWALLMSDGTNYRAFVGDTGGIPVNSQTGTTYTYLSGDRGKLVTHTNAAAIAGTLPQGTGAFGAGWSMWVGNRGAGTLTVTPTTSTIDGAASLELTTNQGALIVSDGTNYFSVRGIGGVGGALTHFTESVNTATPNATVPVVRLLATNAATNVDMTLSPKGTGALTGSQADNLTAGGNKRGTYAVDWQLLRTAATQVAGSNASTIGGGRYNTATGLATTVAGGESNSAGASYATAGGGQSNNASGANSTIAGGIINTASGSASAIGGGNSNTASGSNSATVAGGGSNTASGNYATVFGGFTNIAGGDYSGAGGRLATTRGLYGAYAWSSGNVGDTLGVQQMGRYIARQRPTDATPTVLALDGGTPAAATSMVLPNNSAYKFTADVSAKHNGNATAAGWQLQGVIRRGANAAATAIVGTPTSTSWLDSGASTWTCVVQANTTLGSLEILVTGEAAKTVRWTAVVHTAETVD